MTRRIQFNASLDDAWILERALRGQHEYLAAFIAAAERCGDIHGEHYVGLLHKSNAIERIRQSLANALLI